MRKTKQLVDGITGPKVLLLEGLTEGWCSTMDSCAAPFIKLLAHSFCWECEEGRHELAVLYQISCLNEHLRGHLTSLISTRPLPNCNRRDPVLSSDPPAGAVARSLNTVLPYVGAVRRENTPCKLRASRLEAMVYLRSEELSPLSLLRFSASSAEQCSTAESVMGAHSGGAVASSIRAMDQPAGVLISRQLGYQDYCRTSRAVCLDPLCRLTTCQPLSLSLLHATTRSTQGGGNGKSPIKPAELRIVRHISHIRKPGESEILGSNLERATVAERLDCSPLTKANRVKSPAGSLRVYASENRAGLCRWSPVFFSDISPFHSGAAPYLASPSAALKTSMLRATQISPLTFNVVLHLTLLPTFTICDNSFVSLSWAVKQGSVRLQFARLVRGDMSSAVFTPRGWVLQYISCSIACTLPPLRDRAHDVDNSSQY
ncbi:hypothetical protein PR048_002132 [Dryococelus australis]|uniref:Uncharacterized protein n=1 Tax=Dryococelus australis TaxID=614101 RepID=A0ABQ9IJF6_9NEOP|nr:hypothetical protein PR048_002132 [Dryococelus australis]